jgi:DNA-binding CsgD family transcriptional regulator
MSHDGPLPERELRAMLDVVDEARHGDRPDQPMATLTHGLARLVPCDAVAFSELDIPTRRCLTFHSTVPDDGPGDDHGADAYWRWRHQHPVCARQERFGAAAGVLQLADFLSTRQLHQLPIYRELLAPAEHVMALPLPTAPGRTRVFQFFREYDYRTPFSERDRLVLTLLQPHIYAVYREAAHRRGTVTLTARELDVMRCVALGMSNSEIAHQLVVSASTVRKHLENTFQRLGVQSRTAAVARVFPDYLPV